VLDPDFPFFGHRVARRPIVRHPDYTIRSQARSVAGMIEGVCPPTKTLKNQPKGA